MSDHEIVTQHFDDPIGSVIKIDGKCYVKVSNKTHTITHPIPTDEGSVYHDTVDDCADNSNGRMLCPPGLALFFTVQETNGGVLMSFDIPSQAIQPTSLNYTDTTPLKVERVNMAAELVHKDTYLLPSSPVDQYGNSMNKVDVARITSRVSVNTDQPMPSPDMINKMVNKQ